HHRARATTTSRKAPGSRYPGAALASASALARCSHRLRHHSPGLRHVRLRLLEGDGHPSAAIPVAVFGFGLVRIILGHVSIPARGLLRRNTGTTAGAAANNPLRWKPGRPQPAALARARFFSL